MELDLNNLDKSIFTFEWKKFQENKCYPIGPDDFKIDIQYRDENNNLKKEKIPMSDTRKPEFSLKKDLSFYQPYISKKYIKNIGYQADSCARDISEYQMLLNNLRNAYKKIQKGEYFESETGKRHTRYNFSVSFKAKFGQAILWVNIGETFSEFFQKEEIIQIDTIKKLDETLGTLKRRISFLNRKFDELSNKEMSLIKFPTFKNGEEAFEEKINSIISLSHGNTDTAHKIYEFLKSDEFKSFFKD